MNPNVHEWEVLAKKHETPTICTLTLVQTCGVAPPFKAGQCLTVYFPDLSETLGKQYSISSAPHEKEVRITVKVIGRFSNRLCSLVVGERVLCSLPSGTFYPTSESHAVVLLAGGMGVTPFRSIMMESIKQAPTRHMYLLHSSKTRYDMPFADELCALAKKHSRAHVTHFLTQTPPGAYEAHYRRIRFDDVSPICSDEPIEFLISGSLAFVLNQKQVLLERGISRSMIHTESYF